MSETDVIILTAFKDYLLACPDLDLKKGEVIDYLTKRILEEKGKLKIKLIDSKTDKIFAFDCESEAIYFQEAYEFPHRLVRLD